jgi:peptidyl-prolyl cis-trans isomerase SurA
MKIIHHISIILLLALPSLVISQRGPLIIDRVVAVVGDYNVLQSDIEGQFLQMQMSSSSAPEGLKCEIFNFFIEQKLLMNQAKIDSIVVSPATVEQQMESRLSYFLSQFGSEQEMEEYFNKSIFDIRDDLRETMNDMLVTQQVQQSITGDIAITPSEVKSFYNDLPPDSIPFIDSEVKYAQIVAYPAFNEDAIFAVKERLLDLRKRVIDGESFATLAILYSDDLGSATNGGEIGFSTKGGLDKAYAEAAWSLKEGQVSKIVESEFGYHLIQVIERRGELVNTRHILMRPKADAQAKTKAVERLDTLRQYIQMDSISFNNAATLYSEDKNTRANGGLLVNPNTGAASFKFTELETKDYYTIRELEIGEISQPYETKDRNGKTCYKMIKLINRTEPHRANLREDYLLLQNMALNKKKQEVLSEWYETKKKTTYIHVDDSFLDCYINREDLTSMQ